MPDFEAWFRDNRGRRSLAVERQRHSSPCYGQDDQPPLHVSGIIPKNGELKSGGRASTELHVVAG